MNTKVYPHKKLSQKTKQKTNGSVTKASTLFCGKRKTVGVRVDEKLYSRFKPVAQRVFGSVCRPVESFMAAIISMNEEGANFGNTIVIEKLSVERNLRSRRLATASRKSGTQFWDSGVHCEIGVDGEAHETNRWNSEFGWYYDPEYPNDGGVLDRQQRHGHVINKKVEEVKS